MARCPSLETCLIQTARVAEFQRALATEQARVPLDTSFSAWLLNPFAMMTGGLFWSPAADVVAV